MANNPEKSWPRGPSSRLENTNGEAFLYHESIAYNELSDVEDSWKSFVRQKKVNGQFIWDRIQAFVRLSQIDSRYAFSVPWECMNREPYKGSLLITPKDVVFKFILPVIVIRKGFFRVHLELGNEVSTSLKLSNERPTSFKLPCSVRPEPDCWIVEAPMMHAVFSPKHNLFPNNISEFRLLVNKDY